ncbi:MAG: glycosyltransferase [Verrucomicrobia bacterium]|nr:glycosyltransferase [Verrucomicrobiota bacterium]
MKICLLAKRFYTGKDLIKDRYGRLYHLPKYWSEQGAEVDVIALDYRDKKIERVRESDCLTFSSYPSNGFSLGKAAHDIRWQDYDVIVASGHINLARLALLIGKTYHLRSVFDVYDFYPAFMGPLRYFFDYYMRWLLPKFDGVMVVSRALEDWCAQFSRSVCRVPNGVDRDVFESLPMLQSREQLGLDPKAYIFGIFGSLSKELGGSEVLEAFSRFRSQRPSSQLIAGGTGSRFVEGVDGARSLGMLAQSGLKYWASACDCLLIPYRESIRVKYLQSARLAEYLSIGRPIVVTRTGDAATWLPSNYAGWCEPNDAASMFDAMLLQEQKKECVPFPSNLLWEELGVQSFIFIEYTRFRKCSKR